MRFRAPRPLDTFRDISSMCWSQERVSSKVTPRHLYFLTRWMGSSFITIEGSLVMLAIFWCVSISIYFVLVPFRVILIDRSHVLTFSRSSLVAFEFRPYFS